VNLPLPGIARPVGLGDVLAAIIAALVGPAGCAVCEMRARRLNRLLTFTEWNP